MGQGKQEDRCLICKTDSTVVLFLLYLAYKCFVHSRVYSTYDLHVNVIVFCYSLVLHYEVCILRQLEFSREADLEEGEILAVIGPLEPLKFFQGFKGVLN